MAAPAKSSLPPAKAGAPSPAASTSARPVAAVGAAPAPAPAAAKDHLSFTTIGGGEAAKSLLVSPSIPDKSMVYHNHVYVAPPDASGLFPKGFEANNFVQLNGGPIYIIQTHPDQKAGEIGMSAMTRDSARIQPGAPCKVAPWSLGADAVALAVRLQVDVFKEKKRAEIKEDEIVEIVKERFAGHVFSKDQILAADFKGTAITLRVQSIEVPEGKSDGKEEMAVTRYGTHGILTSGTRISCTPNPENRYLIWEKSAMGHANILRPDFKFADMGIGGLDAEFGAIFRRSFASRLFPPAVITQLGIKHVKGMLLYGPPGTGKTLIARQIGKMLNGKEPKVVNGPEILNKYVGASEENIRNLFADAEAEYKQKGDASGLHIIIFDEIDAICKQRGSDKSGTGVHDTVVNQMLSKIDGVDALNNILVIGMTNRKDMIDSALLRPGRLEVHVEIGLPDEAGRQQILQIHTRKMRENHLLGDDVKLDKLAALTKNFSGAEIEGLVKSATSYALYGNIDVTKGNVATYKPDITKIKVVMDHFLTALDEITPAFGVAEDELATCLRGEMLDWGSPYQRIVHTGKMLIRQVQQSKQTPLLSALIEGPAGSGKTALAAKLALESGFPYVKLISPENFVDSSERGKVLDINKVFEDAYKSTLSLIIIDNIERLLEYVPIGPRFSNVVLQCLLVLLKKIPPAENRRLLVLVTTSNLRILEDMDMRGAFNVVMHMPQLNTPAEVSNVFKLMNLGVDEKELELLTAETPLPIGIKELLMVIEMARQDVTHITAARFAQCVIDCGFKGRGITKAALEDDILA